MEVSVLNPRPEDQAGGRSRVRREGTPSLRAVGGAGVRERRRACCAGSLGSGGTSSSGTVWELDGRTSELERERGRGQGDRGPSAGRAYEELEGGVQEGDRRTRADETVGHQARLGRRRTARAADRQRPLVVVCAEVVGLLRGAVSDPWTAGFYRNWGRNPTRCPTC